MTNVNTNIFHNTSLKLTAIYLCILMAISLLFSIGLYRVSTEEVERSIRMQGPVGQIFRSRNSELISEFVAAQDEAVEDARHRIMNSLVLINVVIMCSGGWLSYLLAKRTLKPIEEVHVAQSRFTADASHELRTPIAAMRLENEIALTDPQLSTKTAKLQFQSNIEELDKLTQITEGLLQLAQLDNDGFATKLISVNKIVQEAVHQVQPKAAKKQQTIQSLGADDIKTQANLTTMTQAIVILLDNAVKYSPSKSTITISTKKTKHAVLIQVHDSGSGVSSRDIAHIFERFYRADSSRTKNKVNGYGIGLSIAKNIVEKHSGKLTCTSKPGNGSTFVISLPLNQSSS